MFTLTANIHPITIHTSLLVHQTQTSFFFFSRLRIKSNTFPALSSLYKTRNQPTFLPLLNASHYPPDLHLLVSRFNLMGSGISDLSTEFVSKSPNLGDIPEDCIASILLHLDPPQICKLAKVNRAFLRASSADFIWESKLPGNYRDLIGKVCDGVDGVPLDLSKKDIYAKLCRFNLFDGGTKAIWLEKNTGGVCLSISSKGLTITGIDDRRYWNHIPTQESRFQTVAYLQQIWWFEVDGEIEFNFPAGAYSMFFRLQLGKASKRFGRRICNSEHVHGWDIKPVRFQLSTSEGQHAISQCFLSEPGNWTNYHVGDFVVENPKAPTKVKFSMTQIDCTHTKGGLCLDSVLIYPSEFRERLKRS